ncbi:MAG: deoxyguanosinetriphosphate triphosphohydrolase [bacterium]
MNIREMLEEQERTIFSEFAALSCESRGRLMKEEECPLRPAFQRDRDRIIHCKAFRRLKHKTQVFLAPFGDHYRTRLTHTLEVSQVARTIAKALRLNETLTEAIAMGHDLGHTPFGHAGEEILNQIHPGGFKHNLQSLRVVDKLEKDGKGLNLTMEVRDGIVHHSKGKSNILSEENYHALTLEAEIVRIADIVAYVNHDIDDATRAGILKEEDLPKDCIKLLGNTYVKRLNTLINSVIYTSLENSLTRICMADDIIEATEQLRNFLWENVYYSHQTNNEFNKSLKLIKELYEYFIDNPGAMNPESTRDEKKSTEREVCDFIAGMTDIYALSMYQKIFFPQRWLVM